MIRIKKHLNVDLLNRLFIGVLVLITSFIFLFKLSSLLGGISSYEYFISVNFDNLNKILNNIIYLPYLSVHYISSLFFSNSIFVDRLVSVLFTVPLIYFFYRFFRKKFGYYTSFFATLLFITTSLLLHVSRIATPEIMYFSGIYLICYSEYLRAEKNHFKLLLIGGLLFSVLLYIPGFIYLVLLTIIINRRIFKTLISKNSKKHRAIIILSMMIILAPLIRGIIINPHNLSELLWIPSQVPNLFDIIKRIINVPIYFFVRMFYSPSIWLGRLPILDAFATGMFILGSYRIFRDWYELYNRFIAYLLLLSILIFAITNGTLSVILPLVYVIIGLGIALSIDKWFFVFPKNPIARALGVSILTIAVIASCTYQTRNYFIAWPNNSITKTFYKLTL